MGREPTDILATASAFAKWTKGKAGTENMLVFSVPALLHRSKETLDQGAA
jgi:hypothetical protein